MNLLEETLSDIENCGYATGDVLYVGGEDGRVQMTWEQAEPILDVDYNDDYGLAEIVEDLCVRFKDGAMLIRHEYDGKEWWRFVPAPAKHGVPFKIVKSECGSLADVNYPMGIPDTKEERVSSTVEYVEVYPDGHEVVHHNYPLRMVTRTWNDDELTYELADTSNNAESKTLIMSGKGVPDIEDTLHFTIGTTMFPGVSKTTRADYCLTKIVHHVEHPDPPTTGLWLDRENNVVWFDYLHKYYTLIADSGCDYMNGLDYTPKPPFKPLITATEIINKQEEA